MMLVIETEYRVNQAAETWDGTGDMPEDWQDAGIKTFKVLNVPEVLDVDQVLATLGESVVWYDDRSSSFVCKTHLQPDDWLSENELQQIQEHGIIQTPEPTYHYTSVMSIHE